MMNSMLADAGLPITYWAEVLKSVCYVANRLWMEPVNDIPY